MIIVLTMVLDKKTKDLMAEFSIPFPPSVTEGERKGKKWVTWEAESDKGLSKWKALYDIWQMQTVANRKRIQEVYSFTAVTLKKRVGVSTGPAEDRAFSHNTGISFIPSNVKDASTIIAELEAIVERKKEEIKTIQDKINKMKKLDEDTLNTILETMRGI